MIYLSSEAILALLRRRFVVTDYLADQLNHGLHIPGGDGSRQEQIAHVLLVVLDSTPKFLEQPRKWLFLLDRSIGVNFVEDQNKIPDHLATPLANQSMR